MESPAGAAGTLKVIMNGWYSASQEIVFRQKASSGNLTD